MATSTLEKLKELTDKLPPFEAIVKGGRGSFIEYEVLKGFCVGNNLYNEGDVAVQLNYTSGGSIFPEHQHDEVEYLILFRGSAKVWIDGVEKKVGVGNCVVIPPGAPHKWEFLTDTKLIAVTVPASKGYPHGDDG